MKKKWLILLLVLTMCLCTVFGISACTEFSQPSSGWGTTYTIETAYAEAQTLGYEGTLESFMASIKGADGVGIKTVAVSQDGVLSVTLTDDSVISLGNVKGKDGANGKSAYELYKEKYGYTGTEEEWLFDLANGNLATQQTHEVTFDAQEGAPVPTKQTVEHGEKLTRPQEPTREGYVFEGWFVDGEKWSFIGYVVTEDMTLTAKWAESTDSSGDTEATENLVYTISEDNTYYSVTGYTGNDTKVIIPATYQGLPVKAIGDMAFVQNTIITNVTIGNNVENIGNGAFTFCTGLTSVIIGNNVKSIGGQAFGFCTGLMNVIIPDSVESIGDYAFAYCGDLTSVTIGNSVEIIGGLAFGACAGLTSVTIPNSVESIGDQTFLSCASLTSVTIGNNVKSIGERAFESCYKLIEVYNLSTLSIEAGSEDNGYVGAYAKNVYTANSGAKKLTTTDDGFIVYADDSTQEYYLVGYVGEETEITTLPASINGNNYSIYQYAFFNINESRNTTYLTSITIPSSVESIGDKAFYTCCKLTEVYNLSTLTIEAGSEDNGYVGFYAKNVYTANSGASKLTTTDDGFIVYADDSAQEYYLIDYVGEATEITLPTKINGNNYIINYFAFKNCHNLTSITIPNSVTGIGDYAFYDCSRLTSITIPDSVASIGESVFFGCSRLQEMTLPFVGSSATATSASEGTLFGYIFGTSSYSGGAATKQNYGSSSTTYYIPTRLKKVTVTGGKILYGAFYNCSDLTSVTIPDSVTSIGNYAFESCYKLIEVCNLSTLSIEAGSTDNGYVGAYAKNVYTANSGASKLTTTDDGFIVYADDSTQEYYLVGYVGKETEITLPTSINGNNYNIYQYAFYNCSGLTGALVIPNSVTSIGNYAFIDCRNLTSIIYNGTMAQWNAISKGTGWDYYTNNYTVTCTDGTLDKNGEQIG